MLDFYVIKHIPTGHYLPAPVGRGGRGGSHVEPVAASEASPPRLFHNEKSAKTALTAWLKGVVTVDRREDIWGEWYETWHIKPMPHRKREEMAVVPARLVLE